MNGVWAAPGRVNLIGEHTDYNLGYVLPIALPLTTRAEVTLRAHPGLSVRSSHAGAELYVEGVSAAFREAGFNVPGLEISLTSDVPIGAGLSREAVPGHCVGPWERVVSRYVVEPTPQHQHGFGQHVVEEVFRRPPDDVPTQRLPHDVHQLTEPLLTDILSHDLHASFCPAPAKIFPRARTDP